MEKEKVSGQKLLSTKLHWFRSPLHTIDSRTPTSKEAPTPTIKRDEILVKEACYSLPQLQAPAIE